VRIKDLPLSERPREKALRHGIETLSNIEVLAIIIGSGVRDCSALDIATKLITITNGLRFFDAVTFHKIQEIAGINQISALRLSAVFELVRRIEKTKSEPQPRPLNAEGIFNKYKSELADETQEQLILLFLSRRGAIVREKRMYKGTGEYFPISVSEIISELLANRCLSFALVHNHPSGEATPSDEDLISTKVLADEAARLRINLKDHVIIAQDTYYSFAEHELIKMRAK